MCQHSKIIKICCLGFFLHFFGFIFRVAFKSLVRLEFILDVSCEVWFNTIIFSCGDSVVSKLSIERFIQLLT